MRCSLFFIVLLSSCAYNELATICEPDEKMFVDLVQPIIEENCLGCHREFTGRPSVLTTYDGVINAVNNHGLRDEVESRRMPPYGSPTLSDIEVNIIKSWIDCE